VRALPSNEKTSPIPGLTGLGMTKYPKTAISINTECDWGKDAPMTVTGM